MLPRTRSPAATATCTRSAASLLPVGNSFKLADVFCLVNSCLRDTPEIVDRIAAPLPSLGIAVRLPILAGRISAWGDSAGNGGPQIERLLRLFDSTTCCGD